MQIKNSLPPALFIAGTRGLDILNSLATPVDEPVDWWSNGDNFLSWMKQAGLLGDDDIAVAKSNISTKQLDQVAANARELREWFRGFVKAHKGKSLTRQALPQLAPLTRLLEADELFWSLESTSAPLSSFHLRARRRWRKPESLLAPIAQEIATFISSADFRHIKACPGKKCVLLFLDQTRQHTRRWCSMAFCGNRAKQDAHLARLKKHENQIH